MGKVVGEITMSLDGFIAGPDIANKNPMGTNGELLHDWIFTKATEKDKAILAAIINSTGAVILGNHTYSIAIDDAWGGATPFKAPAFVLCHRAPAKRMSGFEYITEGIEEALKRARKAAGEKDTWVMGGANVIQQYLKAGLIDEFRLHISPMLLMRGTRLFDNIGDDSVQWVKESVTETSGAIHLQFRIKE